MDPLDLHNLPSERISTEDDGSFNEYVQDELACLDKHDILKTDSDQERLNKLKTFIDNPWYEVFCGILQAESNKLTKRVFSEGFLGSDVMAVLLREQQIGAAPTYLAFQEQVISFFDILTRKIEQQNPDNHVK